MPEEPQDLRLFPQEGPLLQALAEGCKWLLLEAPPGAGKTTRVPPACLDLFPGQIWVLEPRRLAARYAARWVAQSLGEELGQTVGYQVRLDRCGGPHTRLIYMTQGVFARHLSHNPQLQGVDLVVLDEFHERSLDNDLALAWLRGQDRVVTLIMSATLPQDLSQRLGPSKTPKVIRWDSPLYPVSLSYRPGVSLEQLLPQMDGSGLVFLPGMREIRAQAKQLQGCAQKQRAQLQILHGSLTPQEQDQVLGADPRQKRWVLTTNVAETSLTVPGIQWVVDSGLARYPLGALGSALSQLETRRISQFSARQRSGRAGRQGPGQAVRLYREDDFLARPEAELPEILHCDLSALVLLWLHLGAPELPWLDPPPAAAWQSALELLQQLEAVELQQLSPLGQAMTQLPLEPRLARLLLSYPRAEGVRAAAWLANGGDRQQSDLQEYLLRSAAPSPEEVQLAHLLKRCPRNFAQPSLEQALLGAFPDRVAQLRRGQDLLLAHGNGYRLQRPPQLRPDSWLLALDLEVQQEQVSLSAWCELSPELLLDRPELQERQELAWNAEAGRVEELSQLSYGQLVLEQSRRRARPSPQAAALLERASLGSDWYRQQQALELSWQARYRWCKQLEPELPPLPSLSRWHLELCASRCQLQELEDQCYSSALEPGLRSRIERLCPSRLPLGRRQVEVHYPLDQMPWLASKLVDFFGRTQGPQLAGGRIPLVYHLLAPNFRPLQITQDLAGFWQRHYPKIRQELRRRYPRHPWPEDPLQPIHQESGGSGRNMSQ